MLTLCTTIIYKFPTSTVRKSTLQNVNSSEQKCAIKPIVLSTQVGGVGGCNFLCSKCYSLASPRTLAVAMPEFRRVYAAVCATPRHSTHSSQPSALPVRAVHFQNKLISLKFSIDLIWPILIEDSVKEV